MRRGVDLVMNRYNYKWPARSVEALIPARPVRPETRVLVIGNSVRPVKPSRTCIQ